jgi:ribosomal subunit interface protein
LTDTAQILRWTQRLAKPGASIGRLAEQNPRKIGHETQSRLRPRGVGWRRSNQPTEFMKPEITITTLNFEIHEPFRAELTAMIGKLLRHREKILGVKVTIEGDYHNNTAISYRVRMDIQTTGPDIFASARADHLLPALRSALDIAERRLTERMRVREEVRRHPHAPEIGHDLPKTIGIP